jgi:hypothetical protein
MKLCGWAEVYISTLDGGERHAPEIYPLPYAVDGRLDEPEAIWTLWRQKSPGPAENRTPIPRSSSYIAQFNTNKIFDTL